MLALNAFQFVVRYDLEDYNCRHMSRDEELFLESLGFNVTLVVGQPVFTEYGHMWIRIGGVDVDSVLFVPFIDRFVYEDLKTYKSYNDYLNGTVLY